MEKVKDLYDNYLMHVGNKNSGRYPRGSGDDPYQHVSPGLRLRLLGRKKPNMKAVNRKELKRRRDAAYKRDAAARRDKSEKERLAEEKKKRDEKKRKILESPMPEDILKNIDLFTNDELQSLDARMRLREKMYEYASSDKKREDAGKFINKLPGMLSRGTKTVGSITDAISTAQKLIAVLDSGQTKKK